MIRFVLVGGYPFKAQDGGKAMCKDAITGLSQPVNILICLFARKRSQWEKLLEDNKQFFIKNLPEINLTFMMANEKDFVRQIEESNLIYFSGGDSGDLIKRLNKCPRWLDKLNGKNVMGSSAGTDIFSKYSYDVEFFKCLDNNGPLSIKTIVHYKSSDYTPPIGWDAAYKQLDEYKENLPVWALAEGEHKTIDWVGDCR